MRYFAALTFASSMYWCLVVFDNAANMNQFPFRDLTTQNIINVHAPAWWRWGPSGILAFPRH